MPQQSKAPVLSGKFIILHTIDITDADLTIFKRYSQYVVKYDFNVEGLAVIENLIFDYLFLDLRDAQARKYYDTSDTANYNIIIYCSFVEKFDAYIENLGGNNTLFEFPQPAHYKSQFDLALLTVPIDAPNSTCLSCLIYGYGFFNFIKEKAIDYIWGKLKEFLVTKVVALLAMISPKIAYITPVIIAIV